jgi:site-specific recombinase XerD
MTQEDRPSIRQAIEEYRYSILRLSHHTQDWYTDKLNVFAAWCEQENVTLETLKASHVRRFLDDARQRINPQTGKLISSYTIHGYARTIKAFLRWCSREEGLEDIVSEKTARRIEMPRIEQRIIEVFTDDHIARLFRACEKECTPTLVVRDKAILSVLLDTGIRASELCGLTMDCLFLSPTDSYIKVFGKGKKWRECPLGKGARTAVYRYVTRYRHAPEGEDHVFLSQKNRPLTSNGLYQMMSRLCEWGRVTGVRCCVHDFRHTFATRYIEAGGSIYDLSRLLGHSSIVVTEHYIKTLSRQTIRSRSISVLDLQQKRPDSR